MTPAKYIKQGDIVVSSRPVIYRTTLGSCVSVCLWDPTLNLGGINHYTVPMRYHNEIPLCMCGEFAITSLIRKMLRLGCQIPNITAGVYGGGGTVNQISETLRIGDRNTELAYELLKTMEIKITRANTGHTHGLKVIFDTSDGSIKTENLQKINSTENASLVG